MAELVNLRLHRKRKAKAQREEQAAEHRFRFGLSKDQRRAEQAEAARAEKLLDGHRRDGGEKDGDAS